MTDDRDHETPGEPAVEELPEDELDLDDEGMLEDEDEEDPGPPHPVNWYLPVSYTHLTLPTILLV